MGITQITINIVIRPLSAQLVIKSSFAITPTKTFLVVQSSFGGHFLRLKYLSTTSWATFLVIVGRNLTCISDNLRTFCLKF